MKESAGGNGLMVNGRVPEWCGYRTLAEAAKLLGFHPRTLLGYERRGELEGRLIGRRWRFRRADLHAFFDAAPGHWAFS